jgi:hypothetical protein
VPFCWNVSIVFFFILETHTFEIFMLQVTNIQTFESVQHTGGLFQTATERSTNATTTAGRPSMLRGSIHRGFLNAYSRTEQGSILNLCDESSTNCTSSLPKHSILHRRYNHCKVESNSQDDKDRKHKEYDFDKYDVLEAERRVASTSSWNKTEGAATVKHREESITKKRGRRGCKIKHTRLMSILRQLVTDYLADGLTVLVAGHSLGGSLATVLALDILIHFPDVPVDQFQLWTFGGAQVTDNTFLESALALVPRLRNFLEQEPRRPWAPLAFPSSKTTRSQFHRFVSKYFSSLCVLEKMGNYCFLTVTFSYHG